MTREETKKMIMYLKAALPNSFDSEDLPFVIDVWHDAFKDIPTPIMSEAIKNYTKQEKYRPTIAGLQEHVNLIMNPQLDVDFWPQIVKAVSNGIYHSKEEFEKLPTACQRFIGSPAVLKEMASAPNFSSQLNTVVKSHFYKHIEKINNHQQIQEGLPLEVRQALDSAKALELEYEEY